MWAEEMLGKPILVVVADARAVPTAAFSLVARRGGATDESIRAANVA